MAANDTEFLQDFVRKLFNRKVNKILEEIDEAKASQLRKALTHKDSDSIILTNLRINAYNLLLEFQGGGSEDFYVLPKQEFRKNVRYRPQLIFFFRTKSKGSGTSNTTKDERLSSTISCRLEKGLYPINKLTDWGERIKREFRGYKLHKGEQLCTYKDSVNDVAIQAKCNTEADARELFRKILTCCDYEFEFKNFSISETARDYSRVERLDVVDNRTWYQDMRPTGLIDLNYVQFSAAGTEDVRVAGLRTSRKRPLVILDRD